MLVEGWKVAVPAARMKLLEGQWLGLGEYLYVSLWSGEAGGLVGVVDEGVYTDGKSVSSADIVMRSWLMMKLRIDVFEEGMVFSSNYL